MKNFKYPEKKDVKGMGNKGPKGQPGYLRRELAGKFDGLEKPSIRSLKVNLGSK